MGWIARTALASAVSRAGGLGIIETSSGETANCQAEITNMAALGLPFGVNLPIRFLSDDAMLKFVCTSGVKFVTTSAGSPSEFIAPLHDAGITVYHAVPTADTALKSERTRLVHEAAPALAGQTVGLIDVVKSAQDIIEQTVAEFFAITARLGSLANARAFG